MIIMFVSQGIFASAAAAPKLNNTSYTLVKGQSFTLSISNSSGSPKWKNSDTSIMSITKKSATSYTVKGKKAGKATVTVTDKSKNYTCKVTVVADLGKPAVTLSNAATGVSLKWAKITGATGYKVYRKTGDESYKLIKTITSGSTVSYTDTTAKANVTYSYAVKATQGSYIGKYTAKKITFLTQPEIKLSASETGVKVTWAQIKGATSYKLYRKASGLSYSCIKTTSDGKTVSYTDKTAIDGRTYYYYLVAIKGDYKSAKSKEVKIASKKEKGLVADFKVDSGKAIDAVSGKTIPNAKVDGKYFKGGTINLPKSYTTWTLQFVVDYKETSKKGLMNYPNWMDDILRLEETVDTANRGKVRLIWVADPNSSVCITVPVQINAHASCDYEFLPTTDTFWSFSYSLSNGTLNARINGGTASVKMPSSKGSDGKVTYPTKTLWQSFTLNADHKIKELKVYSSAQSASQQKTAYTATGIKAPTSAISKAVNGLSGLGTSYFFSKNSSGVVTMLNTETKKGSYSVTKGGLTSTYKLSDYVQPDNKISNKKYESVHITNAPKTLELGKQYPLTAYPYPFSINGSNGKADEFDVSWSSSDSSIISVIDGLIIAKKAGTAKITATLIGTSIKTTVSIKVVQTKVEDKVYKVPATYKTANGDTFSKTNYEGTTRAIYDAIDYAASKGYNHIIFPKQNYYASPLWSSDKTGGYTYYVPSGMTIEFAKGSVFYLKDNDVIRSKTYYNYFYFGVPGGNYKDTCTNSHLIMDKYYGERYQTKYTEKDFTEESRFVNFGRKSINCSVEITNANYTTGYFIIGEGKSSDSSTMGKIKVGDFASGKLDSTGKIVSDKNWISTKNFITVPDYGKDGYFLSSAKDMYWQGTPARIYDILWFDADKNLLSRDSWLGTGDYYTIPSGAKYCKISLQQSALPTGNTNDLVLALHDDGSSKMCEIKNTTVYRSGSGFFANIGETDGFWVHHCKKDQYSSGVGHSCSIDFENGWCQMRHSVVSNCYLPGYLGANGGYNTFLHTNYIGEYSGFSGETEMLRFINNTTFHLEIAEKDQAHVYYNTYYNASVDKYSSKSLGHIYAKNNTTGVWVNGY